MKFDINKVLTDWSVRTHGGNPDPKDPYHQVLLERVLEEQNYPKGFIKGLIEKVRTYVDNPQNRKLDRVGDPWGSEDDKDQDIEKVKRGEESKT